VDVLSAPQLTIDLGAVQRNYDTLDAMAAAQVGAAIKADAYGLGIGKVAPALWSAGCRQFFAASVAEGIEVRGLLPDADINIFNGAMPGTIDELVEHDLTPLLISLAQLDLWSSAARSLGRKLPAGLHFDTGMSRTGLTVTEAQTLEHEAHRLAGVDVRLILSHLACADDRTSDHPELQLKRFAAIRSANPAGMASLANSAGTHRHTDFHFDLVRPGISLYGGACVNDEPNPMEPVVALHAPILQIDHAEPGQTVGYGATYEVRTERTLAVIPVGYADGFLRSGSNSGHMHIGGHRCPIVGRVSMDLTVFDVSAVPPEHLWLGAPVEVIGPNRPLDEVAAEAGTIGYELLTELGSRYERVYLNG
jgi:alanine racemase